MECNDNENISTECHNESILPPNACVCELPAAAFKPEYATFNLVLIVIVLPTVAVFGVITNALALFVYTRSHMLRSTTNIYLAALAVSDIFVDVCGISSISIDSARRFDPILNDIHLAIIPYTLPLCYLAQMCSVYFTVMAALDCYTNIPTPDRSPTLIVTNRWRAKVICATPSARTKLYIGIVVIVSFLYNCITFADLHVVECVDHNDPDRPILKKEICPTDLRMDPTYSQLYKVYMYAVFMTFLPFAVLLTLNCLIVWKIYRMPKGPQSARSDEYEEQCKEDECSSSENTTMLVMVVALFLVCNSIALAVNIIETFGQYPMEDTDAANRLFFVIDIGNFLVVFNSSANFLIYYAFSKAFRAVLTRRRQMLPGKSTSSFTSLNTHYYVDCSSIKLNNEENQETALDKDKKLKQEPLLPPPSAVETTAQAIAAITVAISRSPFANAFLNVTNGPSKASSRGTYELLPVRRISPSPCENEKGTENHVSLSTLSTG